MGNETAQVNVQDIMADFGCLTEASTLQTDQERLNKQTNKK